MIDDSMMILMTLMIMIMIMIYVFFCIRQLKVLDCRILDFGLGARVPWIMDSWFIESLNHLLTLLTPHSWLDSVGCVATCSGLMTHDSWPPWPQWPFLPLSCCASVCQDAVAQPVAQVSIWLSYCFFLAVPGSFCFLSTLGRIRTALHSLHSTAKNHVLWGHAAKGHN